MRVLFFSQNAAALGLTSSVLEGELRELAKRATETTDATDARVKFRVDSAKAALVAYVHRMTGHFHDIDVAALIGAAEAQHANENLPADVTALMGGDSYTAEAHVQWRQRESCQRLLDGESKGIVDAIHNDMEKDLRLK